MATKAGTQMRAVVMSGNYGLNVAGDRCAFNEGLARQLVLEGYASPVPEGPTAWHLDQNDIVREGPAPPPPAPPAEKAPKPKAAKVPGKKGTRKKKAESEKAPIPAEKTDGEEPPPAET